LVFRSAEPCGEVVWATGDHGGVLRVRGGRQHEYAERDGAQRTAEAMPTCEAMNHQFLPKPHR
jgi:hypothetical protein